LDDDEAIGVCGMLQVAVFATALSGLVRMLLGSAGKQQTICCRHLV